MSDFDDGEREQEKGSEPEFSIARSKALIPMLVMAALAVLVILLNITRARSPLAPIGAPADQAFAPKDFPSIFAEEPAPPATPEDGTQQALFPVPAPPFSEGIYPCSTCHDETMPPDPERRELTAIHDDIVLHHDEEHRWCLDCHDTNDRDQLHLASGARVPFAESYRLCGQCHGTQYRDWRVGIHGKRTGNWDGGKQYLLCVHCHNPHSPRFSPLPPLPPPIRPQYLSTQAARAAGRASARPAVTGEEVLDGRRD